MGLHFRPISSFVVDEEFKFLERLVGTDQATRHLLSFREEDLHFSGFPVRYLLRIFVLRADTDNTNCLAIPGESTRKSEMRKRFIFLPMPMPHDENDRSNHGDGGYVDGRPRRSPDTIIFLLFWITSSILSRPGVLSEPIIVRSSERRTKQH